MDEHLKKKILSLLDEHRIMTVATLRPDGWPQATTVGYVNEGLTLYFLCGLAKDTKLPGPMPTADQVCIFRLTPTVISVLDYSKGFGHTELVTVDPADAF